MSALMPQGLRDCLTLSLCVHGYHMGIKRWTLLSVKRHRADHAYGP